MEIRSGWQCYPEGVRNAIDGIEPEVDIAGATQGPGRHPSIQGGADGGRKIAFRIGRQALDDSEGRSQLRRDEPVPLCASPVRQDSRRGGTERLRRDRAVRRRSEHAAIEAGRERREQLTFANRPTDGVLWPPHQELADTAEWPAEVFGAVHQHPHDIERGAWQQRRRQPEQLARGEAMPVTETVQVHLGTIAIHCPSAVYHY